MYARSAPSPRMIGSSLCQNAIWRNRLLISWRENSISQREFFRPWMLRHGIFSSQLPCAQVSLSCAGKILRRLWLPASQRAWSSPGSSLSALFSGRSASLRAARVCRSPRLCLQRRRWPRPRSPQSGRPRPPAPRPWPRRRPVLRSVGFQCFPGNRSFHRKIQIR